MDKLDLINSLYKPIQPSISQTEKKVLYQEVKPKAGINRFVYCYWQLKTITPLDEQFTYRVVADGCIDIIFDLTQTSESFVMGFCKKYTEFPLANSFDYAGIRFFPSTFPLLFKINAKTLSNNVYELHPLLPEIAKFIKDNIRPTMELSQIALALNKSLDKVISRQHLNPDDRFYDALYLILKNHGNLETEKELDTGLSPRQLRRVFDYYIGTSPKAFSKVVQFQNLLHAEPSLESLRKNKPYYDIGYCDQSHFIRDFKNYYGVTPTKAFN